MPSPGGGHRLGAVPRFFDKFTAPLGFRAICVGVLWPTLILSAPVEPSTAPSSPASTNTPFIFPAK